MRAGICDFPSRYAFPPYGYGGIERWLWAVAVGAQRAGADVWLIGPAWRADLPGEFNRFPVRLELLHPGDRKLADLAALDFDLLVVGHEYPSLSTWRGTWAKLGCDVATFQHDPIFQHSPDAFDGRHSRLYCYSPEMLARYGRHTPVQELSVQFGRGEEDPPAATIGRDLVWLGRIDAQKAPHLAARAAGRLRRRIRIIGPVLDEEYFERHHSDLIAPHVELVGELSGADKLDALRKARTMVYTCARDYIEAGAAIFGEALRSGTPVASLVWRSGSCAEAALCDDTGVVHQVEADVADDDAVDALVTAIENSDDLQAKRVQEVGLDRFDPARHFRVLAGLAG